MTTPQLSVTAINNTVYSLHTTAYIQYVNIYFQKMNCNEWLLIENLLVVFKNTQKARLLKYIYIYEVLLLLDCLMI